MSTAGRAEQLEREKQRAAAAALAWVKDGMRVGLGSGSTVHHFIRLLGERCRSSGLQIEAVATSRASESLARQYGIILIEPERGLQLDLAVDGADEIGHGLSLIKGGGGALLREKVVAQAAKMFLVVADSSKRVERLGAFPLPLEVVPFAVPWVMDRIAALGAIPVLRAGHGSSPYTTDQQNSILDCEFGSIADPAALAAQLESIAGIAEHGLFVNCAGAALIASGDRVHRFEPDGSETAIAADGGRS